MKSNAIRFGKLVRVGDHVNLVYTMGRNQNILGKGMALTQACLVKVSVREYVRTMEDWELLRESFQIDLDLEN